MSKNFKGKIPQNTNFRAPLEGGEPEKEQGTSGQNPKTCNHCKKEGHFIKECPKLKMRVNAVDTTESETESSASTERESEQIAWVSAPTEEEEQVSDYETMAIEIETDDNIDISILQAEAHIPHKWDGISKSKHVRKAKLMTDRPELGKAHLTGKQKFTHIITEGITAPCLLDTGATCSVVSEHFLNKL